MFQVKRYHNTQCNNSNDGIVTRRSKRSYRCSVTKTKEEKCHQNMY